MRHARFGPAGNAESFSQTHKSSLQAPEWLRGLGLDAYEYQCGRGVNIGEETARKLGALAAENDVALSLHSPYYINLAGEDAERRAKNIAYILQSARAAALMGATRVVVHTGAAGGGLDRDRATETALNTLREALSHMDAAGLGHITLCPETMGKMNQLGTLEEVLRLCREEARLLPCVDFGHLYARSHGAFNTPEAFAAALDAMESALGSARARMFHIHFSKIAFSKGGEVKHLTLADTEFGPDFRPLAALMRDRGYTPVCICESAGTQAEDAAALRDMFFGA
ncbi:MAG: TIM barrel protein [Oscillospiraceae bacterium]|jgi:deoxyribonuclease-4|nr:TIM barrel protein [Oscillospiraceae bacterium]